MIISAEIVDEMLKIEKIAEDGEKFCWSKNVSELVLSVTEETDFSVDKQNRNKVFLWNPIEDNILMVYSNNFVVRCLYGSANMAYLRLVRKINEVTYFSLSKNGMDIRWFGGIINRMNVEITDACFKIGDRITQPFDLPVVKKNFKNKSENPAFIREFHFDLDDLVDHEESVNMRISIGLKINGFPVEFLVKNGLFDADDPYKHIPVYSLYYKNHALQMKSTRMGTLLFVCRPMQEIEYSKYFRFWESSFVSGLLYKIGLFVKNHSKRKIAVFYEKFCEKAEEGCYDVFLEAQKNHPQSAYYIIDKKMPDYERIKDNANVVKKYSAKYYWLLFRANSYVSTETPFHLTVLRSNNKYFRKSIADNEFIFLQHGITYLKFHGRNSPFITGKEATPTYVVVNSEKEKNVVSEMFMLDSERVLKLGMAIFSKIGYKHLSQVSEDIVVVMLTWKPYEEYMDDFTESTYYQNTLRIFKMLSKYMPQEHIKLVIHPKTGATLEDTELSSNIWREPISEALNIAKLLITDYSSVCYNSFYQGGGVVFFQEDLEYYEKANGKLIPADDEYIGKRAFSFEELDEILCQGIHEGIIQLNQFRDAEFERRYRTINEFSDGKNIERICQALKEKNLI